MAQELKIANNKEVVATGFVTYTQEVAALAAQGYVVDIRSKFCPQWQLGLFVCNMLLLEDEDEQEAIVPIVVHNLDAGVVGPVVADNVVAPVKKAAGRPSKADKAKAELQAKLGDATNSIRGDKQ